MGNEVKLARPGLQVAIEHDNRHKLSTSPIARESIPMLLNDPDAGIAGFTYTWVNGESKAGAILVLFGPAIGDTPIVEVLPDRPVSESMDFGDWTIEHFSMRHDLQFGHAEVKWDGAGAKINLAYDAFHPPYAYGSHKDGCPSYTALDRIEQSGTVKGTVEVHGKTIAYNGLGHRDHSWGTRDWGAWQHYTWFQGQTAEGVSVHFWRFIALGKIELRGYVAKDGLLAEITAIDLDVIYSDDLWQQKLLAVVTDEAGRTTKIEAEFYAQYTLVPSELLHLREGAARATYDGKPGVGWLEVAWPPSYLEYVKANGPY